MMSGLSLGLGPPFAIRDQRQKAKDHESWQQDEIKVAGKRAEPHGRQQKDKNRRKAAERYSCCTRERDVEGPFEMRWLRWHS